MESYGDDDILNILNKMEKLNKRVITKSLKELYEIVRKEKNLLIIKEQDFENSKKELNILKHEVNKLKYDAENTLVTSKEYNALVKTINALAYLSGKKFKEFIKEFRNNIVKNKNQERLEEKERLLEDVKKLIESYYWREGYRYNIKIKITRKNRKR